MGKKKDLPFMPWYWGDWFKAPDVQALPRDIRCTWFEMIGRMWESKERGYLSINGRKPTDEEYSSLFGFGSKKKDIKSCKKHIEKIIEFGLCSVRNEDGILYCRRIIHDEEKRETFTKYGKKGGNPIFRDKGVVDGRDNPNGNPLDNHKGKPSYEDEVDNESVKPELKPKQSDQVDLSEPAAPEPAWDDAEVEARKFMGEALSLEQYQIRGILEKYGLKYVQEKIALLLKNQTTVKFPAQYFMAAIKNNYVDLAAGNGPAHISPEARKKAEEEWVKKVLAHLETGATIGEPTYVRLPPDVQATLIFDQDHYVKKLEWRYMLEKFRKAPPNT